jgi:hypothetical protein
MLAFALLAAVLGTALAVAWVRWKAPGSLAASAAWLVYAPYEYLMHARVLCSGECNIRVDLLLFWPVLAALTLAVPVRAFMAKRGSKQHR